MMLLVALGCSRKLTPAVETALTAVLSDCNNSLKKLFLFSQSRFKDVHLERMTEPKRELDEQ